jgi:hypothetical protein
MKLNAGAVASAPGDMVKVLRTGGASEAKSLTSHPLIEAIMIKNYFNFRP